MEASVRELFARYERFFNNALGGDVDMAAVAAFYTSEFIAASPAGVRAGRNNDQLKRAMVQGYERYRVIGMKQIRVRDVRLSSIDEHHCVAHVAWTATYGRRDRDDVTIDFEVHYFVQKLHAKPKIFGWVSGDELAVLREHGMV